MTDNIQSLSAFIDSAPPGELNHVVDDIKKIVSHDPNIVENVRPALIKYHEEQFSTVSLPGYDKDVIVSSYNRMPDSSNDGTETTSSVDQNSSGNRYFDPGASVSFKFDPVTYKVTDIQAYEVDASVRNTLEPLLKALQHHLSEHFPNGAVGVYPVENGEKFAITLVSNKYSPHNFWSGRWRSCYTYVPDNGSITGCIKVDVHYYEDGNVRLITNKDISFSVSKSASADEIAQQLDSIEQNYHVNLDIEFESLNDGAFKSLRRQLPVTRQKVDWFKISTYTIGKDLSGLNNK